MGDKPKIGIFKLSSCDGCQAIFLDIPFLLEHCEVVYWVLGKSNLYLGEIDIAFVEGSVSTPEEAEFLKEIRERSKILVTIGACATSGGIQALRNFMSTSEFTRVYPKPDLINVLEKSTPVSEWVKVDYEIYGCPINPTILENFVKSYLHNKRPMIPDYPLCMECKIRGNICVMDAYGIPCLGPVVRAGCGALCPSVRRGCYGCFGPCKGANISSLISWFGNKGLSDEEIKRLFQNENAYSKEFRKVLEREIEGI